MATLFNLSFVNAVKHLCYMNDSHRKETAIHVLYVKQTRIMVRITNLETFNLSWQIQLYTISKCIKRDLAFVAY